MSQTPFQEESVSRWRQWMQLESLYGFRKFPIAVQYDYYQRVGVASGDFSWKESAVSYLMRGVTREIHGVRDLRQVQNVGKAALNIVNLAVTAECYHREPRATAKVVPGIVGRTLTNISQKFSEDYVALNKEGEREFATGLDALHDTYVAVMDGAVTPAQFVDEIVDIAAPINATFIMAAQTIGWPQPGVSSTEDVRPWHS